MTTSLLVLGALLLAWSNGANDNMKGVATLRGSGALTPRRARWLATVATAAGCCVSLALAGTLAKAFRGAGLLPDDLLAQPRHLAAIAGAAAFTILIATRLGMPTSTTHALLGALLGSALVLAPSDVDGGVLITRFVRPLLVSPWIAIGLTLTIAWLVRRAGSESTGATPSGSNAAAEEVCVCVGPAPVLSPVLDASEPETRAGNWTVFVGTARECDRRPTPVAAVRLRALDVVHVMSGGSVCFARALNDTPKIAALMIGGELFGATVAFFAVALAMVFGGVLQSEPVARTVSERITAMTPSEGVAANLATAAIVLSASALALPVSTTHVACGALFGIGVSSGAARWSVIARISLAWLLTLPTAALLAATFVSVVRHWAR